MVGEYRMRPSVFAVAALVLLVCVSVGTISAIDSDSASLAGSVAAQPSGVPSAPIDLVATPGSVFINLTWSPPSNDGGSGIIWYNIYKGSNSPMEFFTSVSATTAWYNDTDVDEDYTYRYYVTAENVNGEGPPSNIATGAPLDAYENQEPNSTFALFFLIFVVIVVIVLFLIAWFSRAPEK